MGKYMILYIVCVAVLSFHIRGSQSRSLNDDESGHNISKKSENIEDRITDCSCFPISVTGTPVSKSLPSNDEQERLVVYLYKNKKSGELTAYIPNWKKQSIFPDLTFDIGDKLQTIADDGIINLFDIAKPEGFEETTVKNVNLEIPSNPTSDNQHKNDSGASPQDLSSVTEVVIPLEELTVSTVSSGSDNKITTGDNKITAGDNKITSGNYKITTGDYKITTGDNKITAGDNKITTGDNKITTGDYKITTGDNKITSGDNKIATGVTKNQILNLSLGNKQQPLKGTKPNQNLKNLEIQNQQTPVIADGLFAHRLPGTLGTEQTIIKNIPNQMLKLPVVQNQQTPLSNYEIIGYKPESLVANLIPGKPGTTGETIIINSPEHHSQTPNKITNQKLNQPLGQQDKSHVSNNLVNIIGYLPSEYKNPIFNDWLNKQILSLRSQRPSMSDKINIHVLKLLLIKALYENGIRLSENGDLHDSNGNTLKMSNLNLRPILLSDPKELEKLIATKKCVIPYDLPYLEAVLVTLIYPPRTLAIIPLDSKNGFISTLPGKITQKLCGHSKCHSDQSSRSGYPVKEENTLDINDNIHKDDADSYTAEKVLEDMEPIHSNNIETKNTYTYMGANTDPPVRLSLEPEYYDQYSSHFTLPSDPRMTGEEMMYVNDLIPKASKKKCHHKHCRINASFRSGSEKEEETSLRAFNINKANDENALITEESDGTLEQYEPIYMDYMGSNKDLPVEASLETKSDSQNNLLQTRIPIDPEIHCGKPNILWTQPIFGREIIYLDEEGNIQGRRALEDFDDSQETPENPDEEDYENMLHIKIVGGNPATSSGTPVNSRGRSGLDF